LDVDISAKELVPVVVAAAIWGRQGCLLSYRQHGSGGSPQ
jgi:hypothetical protein